MKEIYTTDKSVYFSSATQTARSPS